MGVDLSILRGSAAAGAAIGAAIPIPVVGTVVGAGAGILAGLAGDIKVGDKAIKEQKELCSFKVRMEDPFGDGFVIGQGT